MRVNNDRKQRGSVLLLELLVVALIIEIILCMAVPNVAQTWRNANAKNALVAVKAISQAEGYYSILYKNGFVNPAQLALMAPIGPSCDSPNLLYGQFTLPQASGYSFTLILNEVPVTIGPGCTVAGDSNYVLTAAPLNISMGGRWYYSDGSGIVRYSDSGPADASSNAWIW